MPKETLLKSLTCLDDIVEIQQAALKRAIKFSINAHDLRTLQETTLELVRGQDCDRWAIRRSGWCMDTKGEWEYEPLPSSRDNAFMKRCRFTKKKAVKIIRKHLDAKFPDLE